MLGLLLMLLVQVEPAAKPPPAAEVTPRTREILARLEEPIALRFPGEVALEDVLERIKRSARKTPGGPGLPVYVDPPGLWRAGKTMSAAVAIDEEAISRKDALARVLPPLAYIVKDDVLIISDRSGIERERAAVAVRACDASPESRALLARLEERVRMPFANETPLCDVLSYLDQATAKPPEDRGIRILVVPEGLREAERSLNSTLQIDLEGVPLKTTLRLMLDQLGLACVVRDGRLVIHSREGIRKLLRNAEETRQQPGGSD